VITTSEADKRRALYKKQVRGVAMGVRILAGGLRKRMNEAAVQEEVRSQERKGGLASRPTLPSSERVAKAAVESPSTEPTLPEALAQVVAG